MPAWKPKAGPTARNAVKTDPPSRSYDCIHHCRQPGNSIIFGLGRLCRVVYVSLYQCLTLGQTWGGGAGRAGRTRRSPAVHVDRRLSRRTCVIYSESDGNDLLVQNELSLGAPRKDNMIHFYGSAFYTNSFVGGEKCLI